MSSRPKTFPEDFALLGGSPSLAVPLHVGCPNIGDRQRFLARMEDILDRRWLTNDGHYVRELERAIAERVGARHCVATCNGTLALEIAIRALGMQGEVIVPSFTFVATAHALSWQGIRPVFCDIDAKSHTLDPRAVESAVTSRTTGILGVHLWGRTCDVEALHAVAKRKGLRLLFDASHAFGCSRGGVPIGGLGHTEVFSFHATKVVNAFEGGAIVTDDDEDAQRMRWMRNFGFSGRDTVVHPGTNGKMCEAAAAMGLTSLESEAEFVATNRLHHAQFSEELADVPGISVLPYDERESQNYQYVVCEVDSARFGLERDSLLDLLHAENILARRYFWPGCHRMEPYRTEQPDAGESLPVTERVASRTLLLPTGTAVRPSDVSLVCALIRRIGEMAPLLRPRLARHERDLALA